MIFSLDTNIFLRFFMRDDEKKFRQVNALFKEVKQRKKALLVEPYVFIELIYALSRYYKLIKPDICKKLQAILALPFLEVSGRDEVREAVEVYTHHGVDFIDALLFVRAKQKENKLLSFDSEFDKLTPMLRVEP